MEPQATSAAGSSHPRRGLVFGLIVVASLVAFLAVFSIWAKRQALETDNWVETSTELLENEEIRTQLGAFLVDELYLHVDVEADLEQRLPAQLKPLAGPAAGGIRELADRAAVRALERPRVQQAWEEANRTAHARLIALVEGDSEEPVTLDLGAILEEVGAQAGIDTTGKVPPDAGQLVVLPPDELTTARDGVDLVQRATVALSVLAIGLFALAIFLAGGWRRQALRSVGFAFIFVGIGALVARGLAGGVVVESLASTAAVEPAIEGSWEIGTSMLADGAGAVIFYGIAIVLGAWLAGPTRLATGARRELAPALRSPAGAYGLLLAILLLLFWWSPTEGFHRLPVALLIIALLAFGFELLRRQTTREFPDADWDASHERWRAAGGRLRERRPQ